MPQVFHILRCYSCKTFQVHQVKKTTRWSCKLCGDKQSVKKVYGEGTGADCRRHVQKLNMLRASEDEVTLSPAYETVCHKDRLEMDATPQSGNALSEGSISKWMQYVTRQEEAEEDIDDTRFTLNRRRFDESKKERKRYHSDREVRGQKRKCIDALADTDNLQHRVINGPSGNRDYNRNLTNTGDKSIKVKLAKHPNLPQNTKAGVPALPVDFKRGTATNSKTVQPHVGLSSAVSKWAQFVTSADEGDSSDSDISEPGQFTLDENDKNASAMSDNYIQQRFKAPHPQNDPTVRFGNISENVLKVQHRPNFSVVGGDDEDKELDALIADWSVP